jgi:hypothetical protein
VANTATWKSDEAFIAAKFGEVFKTEERFGHTVKRVPLSGSNNRRTDGSKHRGDISLPDELDILVEAKRRKSATHQTFFDAAKADAKKHGLSPDNTILIFKTLRQRGFTAIIDADLLWRLLALPGAMDFFLKETSGEPGRNSTTRPTRRRSASKEVLWDGPGEEEAEAGAEGVKDDHEDDSRHSRESTACP